MIGVVLGLHHCPGQAGNLYLLRYVDLPRRRASRLAALTGGCAADLPSLPLLEGDLLVPQPGSSTATATVILQSNQVRDTILRDLQLNRAWKTHSSRATKAYFDQHLLCNVGKNGELVIGFQDTTRAARIALPARYWTR